MESVSVILITHRNDHVARESNAIRPFDAGYESPNRETGNFEENAYEEIPVVSPQAHTAPICQNKQAMHYPIKLRDLAAYIDEKLQQKDTFNQEFVVSFSRLVYLECPIWCHRCRWLIEIQNIHHKLCVMYRTNYVKIKQSVLHYIII